MKARINGDTDTCIRLRVLYTQRYGCGDCSCLSAFGFYHNLLDDKRNRLHTFFFWASVTNFLRYDNLLIKLFRNFDYDRLHPGSLTAAGIFFTFPENVKKWLGPCKQRAAAGCSGSGVRSS